MKKIALLLFLCSYTFIAQQNKSSRMGQTTLKELKMPYYDKDSTASAVVLFEHANRYPENNNDQIPRTDYYFRIKIFDKSSFDLANISIYLRKDESLKNLKAITYNIADNGAFDKNYIDKNDVFSTDSESWSTKKFTLPNIKEGSVIEYSYSIISPYLVIDDWAFQAEIPKIKSHFNASVLGNYKYNARIVGFQKLDINETTVDKKCVNIDGLGEADCILFSFGMHNIPAFKEEKYMLSKKNYISRISFDLKSKTNYNGAITKYTTTWKKADKSLKKYFFNNQTSKKSFFKKKLPESILNSSNKLEQAKQIYTFIQNNYTWNGEDWRNGDAKVKSAFNKKTGDVGEINLSLFNSLNAVDIDAKLVVLSTRNNGLPTKLFPVIFDYNYLVVKVIIDENSYFLDATNKFLPFGLVPAKVLNGEARVLDFKNEGYWEKLKPKYTASRNTNLKLTLNEQEELEGDLMIRNDGYYALNKRENLSLTNKEQYLEEFESNYLDTEVEDYQVRNMDDLEKSLIEVFKIKIFNENTDANKIRLNPILFGRLKENPFKLKERQFPVDFAYARKENYYINLKIPENYTITQLPENAAISLPNKAATFIYNVTKKENSISCYIRLSIHKKIFFSEEYQNLKEFYNQIINLENSYLVLEKKK